MRALLYLLVLGVLFCSCGAEPEQPKSPVNTTKPGVTAIAAKAKPSTEAQPVTESGKMESPSTADEAAKPTAKVKEEEKPAAKPKAKPTEENAKKPTPVRVKKPKPAPKKMPLISFVDTVFNYGKIGQGDVVMHEFEFTNRGNAELVVTDVRASCGCTQPTYPFLPIMPGEKGLIGVKFDSKGKLGNTRPMITLTTNTKPAITRLFLEGFVGDPVKKEKASKPAKDSTLLN